MLAHGFLVDHVALVGCGMIGASIGLGIRKNQIARWISVGDIDADARQGIRDLGFADCVLAANGAAIEGADLVILCVPVNEIGGVAAEIAPYLKLSAIVTDVGSTKRSVLRDVLPHLPPGRFIGGHPIAGSDKSGPGAGDSGLFLGKRCILTLPGNNADPQALELVKSFWNALHAKTEIMTAERHDYIYGQVSHTPQAVASSLMAAMPENILEYTGSGFQSFTRIAGSDAKMWTAIFLENSDNVKVSLREMVAQILRFIDALETGDREFISKTLGSAQNRRHALDKLPPL